MMGVHGLHEFHGLHGFHGLHEAHGFYGFHELHEQQRIWIFPTNFKEPEIFFALFSYIAAEAKK